MHPLMSLLLAFVSSMILLILPTDTSLELSSYMAERQKLSVPAFSDNHQSKKIAYLTFDDGPSVNTEDILDILAQNHIQATFFVMGHTEDYAMKGYQRILEEGHVIALHTFTHDYKDIYKSKEHFFNDIHKLEVFLRENFNVETNIIRLPGGSKNISSKQYGPPDIMNQIVTELHHKGYLYYDWNVDSKDGLSPNVSTDTIFSNVVKQSGNQDESIILLHDINSMKNTVKALPSIIHHLQQEGYQFRAITNKVNEMHF